MRRGPPPPVTTARCVLPALTLITIGVLKETGNDYFIHLITSQREETDVWKSIEKRFTGCSKGGEV